MNKLNRHEYFTLTFISSILLFIFALLTCILGFINHYLHNNEFYHLFSFSKQSHFLILLISIMCFTKFKKTKIYFYITFIALINILINTLVFRNILYDANQVFSYTQISNKWIGFISNFLEYIFMPLLFLVFYFQNHNHKYLNYQHIHYVALYILFYFFIDFILINNQWHYPRLFIIHQEFKEFIWIFIKILLSFIFITYSSFYFCQMKNKKKWYIVLFVLFLFCITTIITSNWNNWLHAKKSFTNAKMGSLLWPESLHIAQTLSDITKTTKTKNLGQNNYILELGAGTGNITAFLINKYGEENIIAIEFDNDLCINLKKQFPKLKVIQGDASKLEKLLINNKIEIKNIIGIVSTLPLSIFEKKDFDQLEKDLIQIIKNSKNKNIIFNEYRFLPFLKEDKEHSLLQQESKIKTKIKCCLNNLICPTLIYTFEK
ncbi:hypothetical protein C6B37_00115 [Candidatus Phytoplasma phoenicium]|uniref:Dimethyladenosine transferase n=1 Tax=Candidatus Phytoplasma phoenicium TaxID=198422 RepID=A0A2S8NVG2_9MOLU|nr:hypothetical protein C6B37_00115 [Candidatus Phytoplasma phoenicium]